MIVAAFGPSSRLLDCNSTILEATTPAYIVVTSSRAALENAFRRNIRRVLTCSADVTTHVWTLSTHRCEWRISHVHVVQVWASQCLCRFGNLYASIFETTFSTKIVVTVSPCTLEAWHVIGSSEVNRLSTDVTSAACRISSNWASLLCIARFPKHTHLVSWSTFERLPVWYWCLNLLRIRTLVLIKSRGLLFCLLFCFFFFLLFYWLLLFFLFLRLFDFIYNASEFLDVFKRDLSDFGLVLQWEGRFGQLKLLPRKILD